MGIVYEIIKNLIIIKNGEKIYKYDILWNNILIVLLKNNLNFLIDIILVINFNYS